MAEPPPVLILVVGPTATGKTELAARLARRFGGEIVGADSIQVYRGLDAASGKPSLELRGEIPHHLVDTQDPSRDFSAGDFVRLASVAIAGIAARGRRPIVAGGTGLYIRALLRGLADLPGRHAELRRRLAAWEARRGERSLHRMLDVLDPSSAARLAPKDRQRVVRAVEVALLSGVPLSLQIAGRPFGRERYPCVKVGLEAPWSVLQPRIDRRVESFFSAGLVEEVRCLLDAGVSGKANCFKALGYREVLGHLRGGPDLDETMALVKANTRRYAKRQLTWFRREPGVRWFDAGGEPGDHCDEIEAYIAGRLKAEESGDGERQPH